MSLLKGLFSFYLWNFNITITISSEFINIYYVQSLVVGIACVAVTVFGVGGACTIILLIIRTIHITFISKLKN